MRTGRPKGTVHTEASVYASIKRFVLAEGRLPSVRDYEAQAHGLPSNSGTVYRHCKHFKALLAKDGISYTTPPPQRGNALWRRCFDARQQHTPTLRPYGDQYYGRENRRRDGGGL